MPASCARSLASDGLRQPLVDRSIDRVRQRSEIYSAPQGKAWQRGRAHGNGSPKPFHIAAGAGPLFQRPCRAAAARPCQASPAAFSGCLAGCRPAAPHGRPAPVVFVLQWRRGAAWIAARCRPPFLCIIPGRRLEPCACMRRPQLAGGGRGLACGVPWPALPQKFPVPRHGLMYLLSLNLP